MKIGVIADTHLKQPSQDLRDLLAGPFRDVEMILHAGDIIELPVLEAFDNKTVLAVWGNHDWTSVRRKLPKKRIIEAGKFKIGLIHGGGTPEFVEHEVLREFENVDCIVYGHVHTPSQTNHEEILLFNPGAFWGGPGGDSRKSFGLLHVDDQISGEILYF
jgi:putative phosphoesterase